MLYKRRQFLQQSPPERLDHAASSMAVATDLPAYDRKDYLEDISIEIDSQWPPWVAISGGLGILLSVYLRDSTPSFQIQFGTSAEACDITLLFDQDCGARDFLEQISGTHAEDLTFSDPRPSFWLRINSPESFSAPSEGIAGSGPGGDLPNSTTPSQIQCTTVESEDGLSLVLKATGEQSRAMTRFLSQLQHITKQLLAATTSGRTLREVDLICDMDRQDLRKWNGQPPLIVDCTVHELFMKKAHANPQSQAVESWDGALTYAELDTLSSRLCLQILELEACAGDCIPLCFEKSIWIVVAMLGVLKSGCSFMLMDVSHPTSRLQTLSNEVKATIILTSSAQKERAVTLAPQVISVSDSSLHAVAGNIPHTFEVSPSAVAAVVFTSGTTGTPKGIQIEHYSICSSLSALAKLSGVNDRTRYYQFSSYAFDAGFGDILMTLISGGCICIPSEEDRLNDLAKSICTFNADAVLLTPTVVRLLSPSDVPCLRMMISGGERVTQDIVDLWGSVLDLIIVYGPAETTVASVAKKAVPPVDSTTRVGFPLNSRVWIARLDDPNKLAPVGAIGEIVVEGPGIARNYINNNIDSSKLFYNATPWAKDWDTSLYSMGRCYRTGDTGYFADDGE